MRVPLCVRLPYLHPELSPGSAPEFALDFLPGLREAEDGFKPGFPLAPLLARAFMRDSRALDAKALETMLNAAPRAYASLSLADEREAVANFAAEAEISKTAEAEKILLEQAQKILVWIWAAEETALEISRLEALCADSEQKLRQNFLEINHPVECVGCSPDLALLPQWRVCLLNAAFFLPARAAVFAEGEMSEDLRDRFHFVSASEAAPGYDWPENLVAVRATLGEVLNRGGASLPRGGAAAKLLAAAYETERLWLAWKKNHV